VTDVPTDEAWRRALDILRSAGVSDADLAQAMEAGPDELNRVVARHLTYPGARHLRPAEVWERAGVDETLSRSLWRAMGFPEVPDDVAAFTDGDVEALRVAAWLFERAGMDAAVVLQQARTMSQAAARIAESHQDVIVAATADADPVEAIGLAVAALPALDHLLLYLYRRHLAAATEQRLHAAGDADQDASTLAVGFADLTGFTELAETVPIEELAVIIERFNARSSDVIAEGGGRVVKTIGDEVMFSAPDASLGASVALTLVEEVSQADQVPPVRVGVATGPVLVREGDVFGPPVNLASRLVAIAHPNSALVDHATRDALEGDDRFRCSPVGQRRLKGLGSVRPFRLRSA